MACTKVLQISVEMIMPLHPIELKILRVSDTDADDF